MSRIFLVLVMFLQVACVSIPDTSFVRVEKTCNKPPRCFENIQSAIDAVPKNLDKSFSILIGRGVYEEKISITKNKVHLIGQSPSKTRIVFSDYAGREISPGKKLSTPGSATVRISGQDVRLENLSIENAFDYLRNDALANEDPNKIAGSQAVALFVDVPSDRIVVRNVHLLGYQDTLFVNSGRSWFDKVLVAGNVDYIFGNGNALFTHSEIQTRGRGKPASPHGFITAPSTQITSEFGLTFINCRFTRDASVPDNSVALGRPWHPTTDFMDGRYADPDAVGKAVYIRSWMDAHIYSGGWYSMTGTAKEGGKKIFAPEDARFFEYQNIGPGILLNDHRRQLTDQEARRYTPRIILGDWQPK